MNAITAPKPRSLNRLEGFALTAILQGFPTFAAAGLLLKVARHEISGGVLLFVVMAAVFHGLLTPWLGPKFPRFFKQSYEPLFFDARLPFSEEIEKGAGAALGIATTGVERAVAVVAGGERALICAAIISGCAMARPLFGHT